MRRFVENFSKFSTVLFCLLFGIAFIVVGVMTNNSMKKADITWAETQATIVAFVENPNYIASFDDDQPDYITIVSYKVDGVNYDNVEYGSYNSLWHVGDTTKIWYNVDNPAEISTPHSEILPLIFIGMGVLVIIFGIFKLIRALRTL